jgi:transcriptional regulator with XRE-family HTH domain
MSTIEHLRTRGRRLRRLREGLGLTQRQLAEKIDAPQSDISVAERAVLNYPHQHAKVPYWQQEIADFLRHEIRVRGRVRRRLTAPKEPRP